MGTARIIAAFLLFASTAFAGRIWVRTSGTGDGSDSTNAYGSIQTGIDNAGPGDTVYVVGGTYSEYLVTQDAGTAAAKIVLEGYPGQTVIVNGGAKAITAYEGRVLRVLHNNWKLYNLTFKDNQAANNGYTRYYGVELGADTLTMRKCRVLMDGDIPSILTHFGDGYRGMVVYGKNIAIDSSIVRGAVEGIVATGVSWDPGIFQHSFTVDTVQNTTCNNLMVGGVGGVVGTYLAMLFEDCVFDTAGEDNVQLANNGVQEPSNSGIIFRRCLMRGAKENAMDMKSSGPTVLVENCLLVDSRGDDTPAGPPDDPDDGGGPGVETGMGENPDVSQYAIFRHNIIGGNHSGMRLMPGYHVYNTIFYNNTHSWRGYNTTSGTDFAAIVTDNTGESAAPGSFKRVVNCIFYDESTSDIHWASRIFKGFGSNFENDYNIYFQNLDSTRWLLDYPDGYQNPTTYRGIVDYKAAMLDIAGWTGKEAHSWASDPEFENVPASPGEYSSSWDFSLQAGSIGLDAAKPLTTASGAGTGSTSLVVADPYYFQDGYGITGEVGDSIKIDTAAAVGIASINYSTATLTLTAARDWQSGDRIDLVRGGVVLNDIGATFTVSPPDPDTAVVYDTTTLNWNKVLYDVTITGNTHLKMSDIQRTGITLFLKNPSGYKVSWDDTISWKTSVPPVIPGAVTWYTFARDTANDVYGELKGSSSGSAASAYFSSLLGSPYDNSRLAAILLAFDARLDAIEDSLNIGDDPAATGDSVTTAKGTGGTLTFSHRCFGTNRLLVVTPSATWGSVTGVTFNGDALTCHADSMYREYSGFSSGAWYMIAPDTGTHDVVVSFSGSLDAVATAFNFTGINQTTPINGAAEAEGTSTGPSVALGSASGDFVLDCLTWNIDGAASATVGADQTQQGQDIQGSYCGHAVSVEAGAASVTMSWTLGASKEWSLVGISINRL